MNFRSHVLGKDWRQSVAILAVALLIALSIRVIRAMYPLVQLWPPEPLWGTPYIGFVKWAFLLGTAAVLSYRNLGLVTSLGVVYCGIIALPLGPVRYPDTVIQQLIYELWRPLLFSLIWGTVCYLLGHLARYFTTVVHQFNRPSLK